MKAKFITALDVRRIGTRRWKLVNPFVVNFTPALITYTGPLPVLTVPAGFETDFASVPRLPLA